MKNLIWKAHGFGSGKAPNKLEYFELPSFYPVPVEKFTLAAPARKVTYHKGFFYFYGYEPGKTPGSYDWYYLGKFNREGQFVNGSYLTFITNQKYRLKNAVKAIRLSPKTNNIFLLLYDPESPYQHSLFCVNQNFQKIWQVDFTSGDQFEENNLDIVEINGQEYVGLFNTVNNSFVLYNADTGQLWRTVTPTIPSGRTCYTARTIPHLAYVLFFYGQSTNNESYFAIYDILTGSLKATINANISYGDNSSPFIINKNNFVGGFDVWANAQHNQNLSMLTFKDDLTLVRKVTYVSLSSGTFSKLYFDVDKNGRFVFQQYFDSTRFYYGFGNKTVVNAVPSFVSPVPYECQILDRERFALGHNTLKIFEIQKE